MAIETVASLLLIEDDATQRHALAALLSRSGYAITVAATGHEALQRLTEQRPDLILLDMFLPELDGWAFLHQMKDIPESDGTPVLIMTGLSVATTEWAQSLGAEDIIRKPIRVEELIQKIETYCEPARLALS